MGNRKYKRQSYFIKKDTQLHIIMMIVGMVTLGAILTTGLICLIYVIQYKSGNFYYVVPGTMEFKTQNIVNMILPGLISAEIAMVIISFVIGVFLSHKIAGPIYRFEKSVETIGTGDLTLNVKLRSKDEFQELAEYLNKMTLSLKERISRVKEVSEKMAMELNKLQEETKQSAEVEGSLAEITATLEDLLKKQKDELSQIKTEK